MNSREILVLMQLVFGWVWCEILNLISGKIRTISKIAHTNQIASKLLTL